LAENSVQRGRGRPTEKKQEVLYSLENTFQFKQSPISLSNAIDRLDDVEGENLAHQDIQLDNVTARHFENMGVGMVARKVGNCHHNSR
jgi:hypothetical protein